MKDSDKSFCGDKHILKMDFKFISQNLVNYFSAISSLEPGKDLNPAYRRTLIALCEPCDISVSCEVISLGSAFGEFTI